MEGLRDIYQKKQGWKPYIMNYRTMWSTQWRQNFQTIKSTFATCWGSYERYDWQ